MDLCSPGCLVPALPWVPQTTPLSQLHVALGQRDPSLLLSLWTLGAGVLGARLGHANGVMTLLVPGSLSRTHRGHREAMEALRGLAAGLEVEEVVRTPERRPLSDLLDDHMLNDLEWIA